MTVYERNSTCGSYEQGDSPDACLALRNGPSCSLALLRSPEWRGLPCTEGKAGAGETQHLATMMVHVTVVTPASWDSLSEDSPLGTEACHSLPPPLTWGLFTRLHLNTWLPDVRLLPSALSPVCPLPSYIQMIQGTKRQGLGDSWGLGTVLRPHVLVL